MPPVSPSLRAALLAIACSAALLAGCDRQSAKTGQADKAEAAAADAPATPGLSGQLDISKRGTPAPDARFFKPDGSPATLADFKGKPVLINLWATWCGPCVIEMPTIDALAGREADRLTVLTVSQDTQSLDRVKPFFAKQGFKHIGPYLDPENNLGFAYETGVMPTTILYDAEGKEVWRVLGGMDWNGAGAATMLEATLKPR